MVHLLHRLYGADAPAPNLGVGHNTKNVRFGKQIARRVTKKFCLYFLLSQAFKVSRNMIFTKAIITILDRQMDKSLMAVGWMLGTAAGQ